MSEGMAAEIYKVQAPDIVVSGEYKHCESFDEFLRWLEDELQIWVVHDYEG